MWRSSSSKCHKNSSTKTVQAPTVTDWWLTILNHRGPLRLRGDPIRFISSHVIASLPSSVSPEKLPVCSVRRMGFKLVGEAFHFYPTRTTIYTISNPGLTISRCTCLIGHLVSEWEISGWSVKPFLRSNDYMYTFGSRYWYNMELPSHPGLALYHLQRSLLIWGSLQRQQAESTRGQQYVTPFGDLENKDTATCGPADLKFFCDAD